MSNERRIGIESKRRGPSAIESLARFEGMRAGSKEGTRWCFRARISIDNINKVLRDPIIYCCNIQPHHRTGSTWRVYPAYDFCALILDSIEGVTQITLMNWGNAIVRKIHRTMNPSKRAMTNWELDLYLQVDFKKTRKQITWLAREPQEEDLVPVHLIICGYLITKTKLRNSTISRIS